MNLELEVTDSTARSLAFQRWKTLRDDGQKNEKPARACMKIFETLYALYGRIDREAERVELVLVRHFELERPEVASTIPYSSSAFSYSSTLQY